MKAKELRRRLANLPIGMDALIEELNALWQGASSNCKIPKIVADWISSERSRVMAVRRLDKMQAEFTSWVFANETPAKPDNSDSRFIYRVWVNVEANDTKRDTYKDIDSPFASTQTFLGKNAKARAQAFAKAMHNENS